MKPRVICGGALLAAFAPAAAVEPDATPAPIARIQIVGTLPFADAGIDRDLLPYPVQVAERDALRQADNITGYMARKLNGVNVNEIAGSPFQADVTYRGYRASPILGTAQGLSVYLDGVRVNEPFGDVVNWDMLPEAAIGKLLLVPGSNPLYGLNTLGGALALQTMSGRDDPGLEAELSAGMAGRRRSDLSYGARGTNGWHSFVAATLFEEDGWRAHSSGRLGNLFLKAGHAGPATEWSASLLGGHANLLGNGLLPSYRTDDDMQRPGLYEDDRRAAYTFPDRTQGRLLQASFSLTHRLGRDLSLAAGAYARDSRRETAGGDVSDEYADYVADCAAGFGADGSARKPASCPFTREQGAALDPAVLNTTRTRQHGLGASVNFHAGRGARLFDAGLTYDRSRVAFEQFEQAASFTAAREVIANAGDARNPTSSVAGTSRAFGLYASGSLPLSPSSSLNASARFNHARVRGTITTGLQAQAPEALTYTRLNPSIGMTHTEGPLTWRASMEQGNRVPTAIELGCADPASPCRLPVGLQSDPYLKQVVARTLEAGVRGHWDAIDADLTLFRAVNRDDILFVGAGATSHAGYFANFERTLHRGAGLGLVAQWAGVQWRLDYSYLRATYDADGSLFTGARTVQVHPGTPIAGLPRHTLKLGLDWEARPGLALGADLQAQSSIVAQGNEDGLLADPDDGDKAQRGDWRVHGFALLNLHAKWQVAPGWELFARVSNPLNRRYETYAAVATDMFPDGRLLRPDLGRVEPGHARFVAPGAPRLVTAGLRYRF